MSVGISPALSGKVAIVTGAARGIGRAIAHAFADAGARVVVADRDGDGAAAVCSEMAHAQPIPVDVDISDVAQIDALMSTTVERAGRLDILVNNAAHACFGFALDLTEADWDYTQAICARGSFFCSQRAARVMVGSGGGKIINLSSMTVPLGHARNIAYSSAKGALEAMTRVLAVELAQYNIQVNAIAPGPVDTDFSRAALSPQRRAIRMSRIPAGRFGTPGDVAAAALFLASAAADWITGTVLPVDGGYTAHGYVERREADGA